MGVWIETRQPIVPLPLSRSLPSWECGLKLVGSVYNKVVSDVTPLVGVWIETVAIIINGSALSGHSPRGSVD